MGKETSERIQTSVLNAAEKKVLVWLAQRQPAWVTSDFLTYTGVVGALVCAVGFVLAHIDKNYLWISSLGLVINWYGDSLDGTLARVRNAQRPVYGFFIDHTLDAVTICIMCIGAGLSPMFRLDVAMLVLVGYLVLSIYTYISTILSGKFLLTYGSLGPTEFRHSYQHGVHVYFPLGNKVDHRRANIGHIRCSRIVHCLLLVRGMVGSIHHRPSRFVQTRSIETLFS